MKPIPCKVNKCISYPTCVNKKRVECKLLLDWLLTKKNDETQHEYWMYMKKYLTKVEELRE